MKQSIRVLLIEDNPGHARLISKYFNKVKPAPLSLVCAERLSTGLKHLNNDDIDVVLLDINLPDSRGIDTFTSIHEAKPEMPIVVVTSNNDDVFAMRAMKEGAQDYIVKGDMSGQVLLRSMRYAIERQRLISELRLMSLVDELTGLYNLRGFRTLSEQNLKIVDRLYDKNRVFVFFSDVDNLKNINDTFGHIGGDRALKDVARLLKKTFRNSDIIARIGGDEFAVLAIGDVNTDENVISERFYNNLKKLNKTKKRSESLSVSIGITRYNPDTPVSLDKLLTEADSLMYRRKQERKRGR